MPRVTNPTKQVTDPVVIAQLRRQGKKVEHWELFQDYAPRSRGKEHSPFAKFYRNTNNPSERMMVVSGLPMVDGDGKKCEPIWLQAGNTFQTKNNVFSALVNIAIGQITLTCKNDQPDGRKRNDRVVFSPQLFLNGVVVPRPSATLLPVDPINSNYANNTLEWDYGVCKRRLRQVEGRVHGYWIFASNPGGEVRIKYNQTGDYRLKLGQYATDADTETIPASVFAFAEYPFTVSDSSTYYPDANPETTSVDGDVSRLGVDETWATIRAGAGNAASDSVADQSWVMIMASATTNQWQRLHRGIVLFDTSGLPDNVTISAATLSIYGRSPSVDYLVISPTVNIYTSNPASNTALANADYGTLGSVAQSDAPIAQANWTITGYNNFALNATGIGNISKTGISKFGVREATYDAAGATPTNWISGTTDDFSNYASEKGAGYKPKLVVAYGTVAVPTVTTQAVSSISGTTATGNGNITALGDINPTAHGVCWNTTGIPTTADSKTDEGAASATGAFTTAMTGLTVGTKYYVRAYATNAGGTSYGAEVTFVGGGVPIVTTQAVTAISGTTATGNGNITDLGSSNPTQHGHCWNTTGSPTTADSKTQNGAASATGAFTSAMTELVAGTKYYDRAYATNDAGTSYGAEVEFWADQSTVYPSDSVARVSSIRHLYRPGLLRMEAGLGALGFGIDIAEAAVRSELGVVKAPEVAPVTPAVTSPTAAPVTPYVAPAGMFTPHVAPTTPIVSGKVTASTGMPTPEPGQLTERAQAALKAYPQETATLREIQRLTSLASDVKTTSRDRSNAIKRAIELKAQLAALYAKRGK